MKELILPAVNLGLLVAFFTYKLKTPVRDFIRVRAQTIRQAIQDARDLLATAQAKYQEFSAKLKAIDSEVTSLQAGARKDAEDRSARIVSGAKQLSGVILSDARSISQGLFEELRSDLRVELGRKVIERAERMLQQKLTGDDRVRLRREFSINLERVR